MVRQQFQFLFCQRFRCPPSEYEERAFRKCLYWQGRLLAPVVRRLNPDFFVEDFKFIRYLGESTGLREVGVDLLSFRDANVGKPSFWRTTLKSASRAEKQADWHAVCLSGRVRSWIPSPLTRWPVDTLGAHFGLCVRTVGMRGENPEVGEFDSSSCG